MRKAHKHDSSDAPLRGGLTSSSCEASVMEVEPRGQPGTGTEHQQEWRSARGQITRRSRMMREYHVRFCEGLGAKSPWSTQQFLVVV